MSKRIDRCPACLSEDVREFHRADDVPVNSVLLLDTREDALNFPLGDIALTHCRACGFIYNAAFDEDMPEYSARSEETQGFSPTFRKWHRQLAEDVVRRFSLHDKRIVEIGCGKGEFLSMLCEIGGNRGIGFDPAYRADRSSEQDKERIDFIADFYSEKYSAIECDFLCCKMTLEHISPVERFLSSVRNALTGQTDTTVFFQVPDIRRILEEQAFWDIYYEHCSYFSIGSLSRLFVNAGFDVLDAYCDYDDQYLIVVAKIADGTPLSAIGETDDLALIETLVDRFSRDLARKLDAWNQQLRELEARAAKVVIWGSGSKGVAYLTTLEDANSIEYVVDINPFRHDHYIPKTGQLIVGPEALREIKPDTVIVMNPVYREEIRSELMRHGLQPEIITT